MNLSVTLPTSLIDCVTCRTLRFFFNYLFRTGNQPEFSLNVRPVGIQSRCAAPLPIISSNTLPSFQTHALRLPSLPPMSALRTIIIMPCINNASQYINNSGWSSERGEQGRKRRGVQREQIISQQYFLLLIKHSGLRFV